jgi:Concanavalin A-like lectin/glucanases superfamily/Putative Ig domain
MLCTGAKWELVMVRIRRTTLPLIVTALLVAGATVPAHASHDASELAASWNFDEGSGPALDGSGHGNDGTFVGAATRGLDAPSIPGNISSLDLDGSGGYVSIPDDDSLDMGASFTTAAWVAIDSGTDLTKTVNIVSKQHAAPPGNSLPNYNMHVRANRVEISMAFSAAATYGPVTPSGALAGVCTASVCLRGAGDVVDATHPVGTWRHIAGTYDDTTKSLRVYLDGVLDGEVSMTTTGTPVVNGESVQIGRRPFTGTPADGLLDGRIDEVRIYGRALGDSEIADLEDPPETVPPVVVPVPDRAPNAAGWYDADVTVDWASVDPAPSSGTPSDPPDTLATLEGTHTYESDPSCDPDGNCATGSIELSIDKTNPDAGTPSIDVNPKPANASTTLRSTPSDAHSGIVGGEWFVGSDPGVGSGNPMMLAAGQLSAPVGTGFVPGSYPVGLRARDASGRWSPTATAVLVVAAPVPTGFRITTTSLPGAHLGTSYATTLTAAGGVPPYKWKKLSKLPKGLKLKAKTGVIFGTPKKQTGTYSFTVRAMYKTKVKHQRAIKHFAYKSLSIVVT